MFADLSNAGWVIHDSLHVDAAGKLILFLPAQPCLIGHCLKCPVQFIFVDMQLHGNRLKMQRQRRTVPDGVGERVPAHIAGAVLLRAEGQKGIFVHPVNRRTGKAKEKRVGKGHAHLLTQVSLLRPMGLVHHDDDVVTGIQLSIDLTKFENCCNQNLPHISAEESGEFLLGGRAGQIGNVGGVKGRRDLCLQINAVIHNHNRRIFEFRYHTQLLRSKYHQQRFAGALEMPDQPFLRIPGKDTADDHIRTLKLLIAADDLIFPVLFIGGEHSEKLEDVHNLFRCDHICYADLHIRKVTLRLMIRGVPRSPHIDGHIHGTIAVVLPL